MTLHTPETTERARHTTDAHNLQPLQVYTSCRSRPDNDSPLPQTGIPKLNAKHALDSCAFTMRNVYLPITKTPALTNLPSQAPRAAFPSGRKSSPATSQTPRLRTTAAPRNASLYLRTTTSACTTRRRYVRETTLMQMCTAFVQHMCRIIWTQTLVNYTILNYPHTLRSTTRTAPNTIPCRPTPHLHYTIHVTSRC